MDTPCLPPDGSAFPAHAPGRRATGDGRIDGLRGRGSRIASPAHPRLRQNTTDTAAEAGHEATNRPDTRVAGHDAALSRTGRGPG